jgi:hypothetical protein
VLKRVLVLGALALVIGAGVRVTTAPSPAVAEPGPQVDTTLKQESGGFGDGRPRWLPLWTRPAPGVTAAALASNGTSVAWVDRKGSIRRVVGDTGKTLWQTPALIGVNRLVVAPQGQVIAYSQLNPASPMVRVLHPRWGNDHSVEYSVDGAVWQAALTGNGARAIVGTGHASLYLIPLVKEGNKPLPSVSRIPIQGIPESLCAGDRDPVALLGTWADNGVGVWGLDGLPRWRYDEREVDRSHTVQLSGDGTTAVGLSTRGARHSDARLHVWDARTGRLLWIESLEAFDPKVRISKDGNRIAVSYAKMSSYNTGATVERKLAVFARDGRRLFADKGGLFFSPELVALSAGGERITVKDGDGNLWTLDQSGRTVSRMRLPVDANTGKAPTIKETIATEDGSYLLLRRGDDQLTLYKAAL